MRIIIIVDVDNDKIPDHFLVMNEVYTKLSTVGSVSYGTEGDIASPRPQTTMPTIKNETIAELAEVVLLPQETPMSAEEKEALANYTPEQLLERDRLKMLSTRPPRRPPRNKEEEDASVSVGLNPYESQKPLRGTQPQE